MPDLDAAAFDEQDQSEVFDEDNTNDMDRGPGEEAEQFEDLVELFDVTSAVGDDDDDDGLIAEDLDDDQIIALADDGDIDDDASALSGLDDSEDPDGRVRPASDEVELEYVRDLDEIAVARSAAQDLEAASLSDEEQDDFEAAEEGGDARA
jgi:hypothetical protein